MISTETIIQECAALAVNALYGQQSQNPQNLQNLQNLSIDTSVIQVNATRKEFVGDYTIVTFSLLKISRRSPEVTATEIGDWMVANCSVIEGYNVIKGFLNISLKASYWRDALLSLTETPNYGFVCDNGRTVVVEYSSPNTNKPLHLGHVRNNLLGYSVARILEANGNNVVKVNLVNDRGIHICKSMIAWQRFGNGETPESSGIKGDHLVGKYYVEFDRVYKAEVRDLMASDSSLSQEDAKREAPIIRAAQEMLVKWEARDAEVYALWEMMNSWVYAGFEQTYREMGVSFDKTFYESNTYLLGKRLVAVGLESGVFYRREDGSVWIDLTEDGLDEKLLLRSDGTSVYMTQDLGTAVERYQEYHFDDMTYVVGNEQNYHFQVLKLILSKLGYQWSDVIYHLSYGMVELPNGKMKSREGTVVDADDLMEAMVVEARAMSQEMGKLDGLSAEQADEISRIIGMGALKYFILKVDPRKTMLFNPAESIDFNGNTAPFVQYTYARIKSLERKAAALSTSFAEGTRAAAAIVGYDLNAKEIELVKLLLDFAEAVREAGRMHAPSVVAAYVYELAKVYNQYYHDYPILKADVGVVDRNFRLALSFEVASIIGRGMGLLGIEMPERM